MFINKKFILAVLFFSGVSLGVSGTQASGFSEAPEPKIGSTKRWTSHQRITPRERPYGMPCSHSVWMPIGRPISCSHDDHVDRRSGLLLASCSRTPSRTKKHLTRWSHNISSSCRNHPSAHVFEPSDSTSPLFCRLPWRSLCRECAHCGGSVTYFSHYQLGDG